MDGAKLKLGFNNSEDVCESVTGFTGVGVCPNNVLNGPPFEGCVAGVEVPNMLPGVVDVTGVCPNNLLEGLKAEVGLLNSELEEGGPLAGWLNRFIAGCEVFMGCPNNSVCDFGSPGCCALKPKRLAG